MELQASLDEAITEIQNALNEFRPAPPPESKPSPPAEQPKWSKENHPAYQPGYRKPGAPASPVEQSPTPASYKVNDTVLAKWVSGDKAFYPARITSITGSSAAPIYIVTFNSYNNTDTVRGHDIKPVPNGSKKRKADDSPAPDSTPTASKNPGVISADADIDPDLASQVRKEPSKVSDGPPRPAKMPRKVKANKELEAGKSKWQEFTTKGKVAKASKKESMFRTGESHNARGEWPQHHGSGTRPVEGYLSL